MIMALLSPSPAAAIIAGRAANGRVDWRVEATGQSYADWQDQRVSAAAAATENDPLEQGAEELHGEAHSQW